MVLRRDGGNRIMEKQVEYSKVLLYHCLEYLL